MRAGRRGEHEATLRGGVHAWHVGRRLVRAPKVSLDYRVAEAAMDPIDGKREPKEEGCLKLERAYGRRLRWTAPRGAARG